MQVKSEKLTKYNAVSNAFYLATLLMVALGEVIRHLGPIPFLSYIALSGFYLLTSRERRFDAPVVAFFSLGVFYICLSAMDFLPRSWTQMDLPFSGQLRQGYFVVAFPILFLALGELWRERSERSELSSVMLHILLASTLGVAIFRIIMEDTLIGYIYYDQLEEGEGNIVLAGYNVLNNGCAGLMLALGYFCLGARDNVKKLNRSILWLCLPVLLFFLSPGLQVKIACIILFTMFMLPRTFDRFLVSGTIIFAIGLTILGILDIDAVYRFDANTGVRLALWKDGIEAIKESGGLGVGFGREAITNFYIFNGKLFYFESEDFDLRYIGFHNSFISMFFRLGVVGGLLFTWIFIRYFFQVRRTDSEYSSIWFAFFLAFFTSFVNMGIESPQFFVSAVLCLAFASNGFSPYFPNIASRTDGHLGLEARQ